MAIEVTQLVRVRTTARQAFAVGDEMKPVCFGVVVGVRGNDWFNVVVYDAAGNQATETDPKDEQRKIPATRWIHAKHLSGMKPEAAKKTNDAAKAASQPAPDGEPDAAFTPIDSPADGAESHGSVGSEAV